MKTQNLICLTNCVVRSTGKIHRTASGKFKREINIDHGPKQRYVVDEIVSEVEDFLCIDPSRFYDFKAHVNGMESGGNRYIRLCLFAITEHRQEVLA